MERNKLVKEGILRLKKFKQLMPQVIKDFEEDGKVNISTSSPLPGILYWADEEQQKLIDTIEKEYGGLVYHGILSNTNVGTLLSLLWVSSYPKEWDMERDDIDHNIVFCYVYNLDFREFSEFGSIRFREVNGGLQRLC